MCASVVHKHEDDMPGRLLQNLEESVGCLLGEHVGFVEDVDLVLALDRGEGDLVADVADVVDAAVAGGVHLDDVEGGAGADGDAAVALAAGVGGRSLDAVERLGQQLGGRGLARAAGAREKIGVADLPRTRWRSPACGSRAPGP